MNMCVPFIQKRRVFDETLSGRALTCHVHGEALSLIPGIAKKTNTEETKLPVLGLWGTVE